jgi:hypothetical protein
MKAILVNIIFLFLSASSIAQTKNTKTEKLKLVDGYLSMEYRYMQFTTAKGDSIFATVFDTCLTPTGYVTVWDTGGPPQRIAPAFLNKQYNITYSKDSLPDPNNMDKMVFGLIIQKMELLK